MKFKINDLDRDILRARLVAIASDYLSEEDKGLFICTTNSYDLINKNILDILKGLLGGYDGE